MKPFALIALEIKSVPHSYRKCCNPFQSVGAIELGKSPEIIRSVINSPWRSFLKGSTPTDAFEDAGIYVYYDKSNKSEAIEFFTPASLTFQGKVLVDKPYKEIRDWLASIDSNIIHNDSGIEARSLGIGLYAPSFDENERPDELVEAIIVVCKGYW